MSKRHKWKHDRYNGKFSSFIVASECVKCGCIKKPLSLGYEYKLNEEISYKAPPCDESLLIETLKQ